MNEPRRVLFITAYTGFGGGERIQLELLRALDPARYVPHLAVPREGQFAQAAREAGVTVHLLPFRAAMTPFVPWLWEGFPVVTRLAALLRDARIDAVISDYHALPYAVAAGRKAGVPVIWLLQGWWFPVFPWQRRFFRDDVPHIVAVSQVVRDRWLARARVLVPDRIRVLLPGVDTAYFHPGVDGSPIRERLGIGPGAPLVALLARFQRVKGHDIFLDMARLVAAQIPDVRFVVAGDNIFEVSKDEQYKRAILDRWQSDPVLHERVTYLGHLDDPRPVMAAADVVVCPSRFESLGMALVEAMAMARPIVSMNRGGPAETIVDGATGFLVPPEDPAGLAGCVIALLRDPAQRTRMGEAGRAHVVAQLSAERYAAQMADLLDAAIEQGGAL
ncbi:glycosyltransferase family 4 protein [Aggregatilinea lenta]|uniref:glycosyltransferase family 4 protein n=1 Tax=Aggregatilinea lenta TaxID=913108 RepID=UPI000E5BA1B6|nr:glycosyltransferase family 4 protein [Aggregatilinea lenta]